MSSILYCAAIVLFLDVVAGYGVGDQTAYVDDFDANYARSYVEALPSDVVSACVSKGNVAGTPSSVVLSNGEHDSDSLASECGSDDICTVPSGVNIRMTSSINVGALILDGGSLNWTDASSPTFLCAGYIQVMNGGSLFANVISSRAIIYIKDNGLEYNDGQRRFLRSSGTGSIVTLTGRELKRTWSLLAKNALQSETSIELLHRAEDMGWNVGDRIVIAPMADRSAGTADATTIVSISGRVVEIADPLNSDRPFRATSDSTSGVNAVQAAEVVHMTRSLVITGDDPTNEDCTSTADVNAGVTICTFGLHTLGVGESTMQISYTRIEKCGQRGILGKYCLHFHYMGSCGDNDRCLFKGNAIETGFQRAIVVHGTHFSTVQENVINDVGGASIYVEDGNELYNKILNNVAICPWPLDSLNNLHGCTVPGTNDDQADTSTNHAGVWAVNQMQHLIGNRMSNHFNGMFYETGRFAGNCRPGATGATCCTQAYKLGRMMGNTFHGHGRFGTYFLGNNYPKQTDVSTSGITDTATCDAFSASGDDRGVSCATFDHVDYGNAFVGTYMLGDVAFHRHFSDNNNNGLYWKATKNFANGCSPHLSGGIYADSLLALPDGATFIMSNTRFENKVSFESNHHCAVGATGFLCYPMYIFEDCDFSAITGSKSQGEPNFMFDPNANYYGGIFATAPTSTTSPFPEDFVALVFNTHSWLLDLPSNACSRTGDIPTWTYTVGTLGNAANIGGILCRRPLRVLKIWTFDISDASLQPNLNVEVRNATSDNFITSFDVPFFQIVDVPDRQGYATPVTTGTDLKYVVRLGGHANIPTDWIVEFSDPVIKNRYGEADIILLELQGRSCDTSVGVTSQHDRRFIMGDEQTYLMERGRGACSTHADIPNIDCNIVEIVPDQCPELCSGGCPTNGWCDCGRSECVCDPGFFGDDCSMDLCAEAGCSSHGGCVAKYLGGEGIPVTGSGRCVCDEGWAGATCAFDPCEDVTCSGHGKCTNQGDEWRCECDVGWDGYECETNSGICDCPGVCEDGLSGNFDRYYCNAGGGCSYDPTVVPAGFCCYSGCDLNPCADVVCPAASSDCRIGGQCQSDGSCSTERFAPDGQACYGESIVVGSCLNGYCVYNETNVSTTTATTSLVTTEVPFATNGVSATTSLVTTEVLFTTNGVSATTICAVREGADSTRVCNAVTWACTDGSVNCADIDSSLSCIDRGNIVYQRYFENNDRVPTSCCFGNADGVTDCTAEIREVTTTTEVVEDASSGSSMSVATIGGALGAFLAVAIAVALLYVFLRSSHKVARSKEINQTTDSTSTIDVFGL